ncbi:hypothetical protein NOK12_30980 [Nocardioides sp. OK12]|uniref:hypothetical protein n=1 Tax=Nocardioides sp. OK12 TaxID=2758661 RepID=UPI0021C26E62|nr:hypothetical protein [Nocardioides sp. OK12]GHJ60580.1 hypothetical protein NOK12_30980 [Nocardioides sp. OK12]
MSSVDDLRSTLEAHAHRVDDPGASPRVVAVHERVRGLRRRRRTAAGALAAVVLAAGVGLAALGPVGGGDGPEPAGGPRTVGGQEVPGAVMVLGREYELAETVAVSSADGRVRVPLPPSEGWRVVSLAASDLDGGVATLVYPQDGVARVLGDGSVQPPTPLGPVTTELTVRLEDLGPEAQVGLAIYEPTGTVPGGVVGPDMMTAFRGEVAGEDLLGAAFSRDGAAEVSLPLDLPRRQVVRISTYCTSSVSGGWVNVDLDGRSAFLRGPCDDDGVLDLPSGWVSMSDGIARGEHTLRVYLTRGSDGPEVDDPLAVLGVGAYPEPATTTVDGASVDEVVEHDGRRWRLESAMTATEDGEPVARRVETDEGPVLVGYTWDGGTVGLEAQSGRRRSDDVASSLSSSARGGSSIAGQLLAGDTYDVRLYEDRGRPFEGSILLYRPVA